MNVILAKTPQHLKDNGQLDPQTIPSAGIYVLAAIAREAGHSVRVADPCAWPETDDWRRSLLEWLGGDADVIGLSTHTLNWPLTRQVVSEIKRQSPHTVVVLGGVHPTHRPHHVLDICEADFCVQGEGEASWSLLLSDIASGTDGYRSWPGIGYRDGDQIVINPVPDPAPLDQRRMPLPAYDLLPAGEYRTMSVETSRGCTGTCGFCSIPARQKWMGLSAGVAVDRIRQCDDSYIDRFTTDIIYISDNCFTIDRSRAADVCRQLTAAGYKKRITMKSRINDLLDDELLSGVTELAPLHVHVGVECGYERGLRLVSKGTTVQRVIECARRVRKNGIAPQTQMSFIIGLPWEEESDCLTTIRFAAGLVQEYGVAIATSWWIPIPSSLWDRRHEFRIQLGDEIYDQMDWPMQTFMTSHPRLDAAAWQRLEERFATYEEMGIVLRSRYRLSDCTCGG